MSEVVPNLLVNLFKLVMALVICLILNGSLVVFLSAPVQRFTSEHNQHPSWVWLGVVRSMLYCTCNHIQWLCHRALVYTHTSLQQDEKSNQWRINKNKIFWGC